MRVLFTSEEMGILGRGGDGGGGGDGGYDGAAQAAADYGIANQQTNGALASGEESVAGLGAFGQAVLGALVGWGIGKGLDAATTAPANINSDPNTVPDFTNSPFFNQGA